MHQQKGFWIKVYTLCLTVLFLNGCQNLRFGNTWGDEAFLYKPTPPERALSRAQKQEKNLTVQYEELLPLHVEVGGSILSMMHQKAISNAINIATVTCNSEGDTNLCTVKGVNPGLAFITYPYKDKIAKVPVLVRSSGIGN